jgi:uncharacterized protein with FMN-binding domain
MQYGVYTSMKYGVYIEALILVGISGGLILAIKLMGRYDEVEAFLWEHDRAKYYIMKSAYAVLFLGLTLNIRFAFSQFMKDISS